MLSRVVRIGWIFGLLVGSTAGLASAQGSKGVPPQVKTQAPGFYRMKRQRIKIFEEASSQGFWVGADHISFPGLGHICVEGSGFAWIPAPYQLGH